MHGGIAGDQHHWTCTGGAQTLVLPAALRPQDDQRRRPRFGKIHAVGEHCIIQRSTARKMEPVDLDFAQSSLASMCFDEPIVLHARKRKVDQTSLYAESDRSRLR